MEEHVLNDMDNFTKDKGKEGEDCIKAIERVVSDFLYRAPDSHFLQIGTIKRIIWYLNYVIADI